MHVRFAAHLLPVNICNFPLHKSPLPKHKPHDHRYVYAHSVQACGNQWLKAKQRAGIPREEEKVATRSTIGKETTAMTAEKKN